MSNAIQQPEFNLSMLTGFIPLAIVFILPRVGVDVKNPDIAIFLRLIFGAYMLLSLFVYKSLIMKRVEERREELTSKTVIYINESGDVSESSFYDYDTEQINKAVKALFMSGLISGAIHFIFNINQGLAVVPITGVIALLTSPLVKMYIFNDQTIVRPFKENKSSLLSSFFNVEDDSEKKISEYKKLKSQERNQEGSDTSKTK
uniref:Inorganic phosphate transport protein PHO88 n=2 Tax=Lygus hesperus TaxID=30085 RepID=A0A146LHQ4_LYGHE